MKETQKFKTISVYRIRFWKIRYALFSYSYWNVALCWLKNSFSLFINTWPMHWLMTVKRPPSRTFCFETNNRVAFWGNQHSIFQNRSIKGWFRKYFGFIPGVFSTVFIFTVNSSWCTVNTTIIVYLNLRWIQVNKNFQDGQDSNKPLGIQLPIQKIHFHGDVLYDMSARQPPCESYWQVEAR